MTEMSGTTTTTGTNASSSQTVTVTPVGTGTDPIDWKEEYDKLLKKYNDVLKELDGLGFTLLSYARTMKLQQ